MGKPPAFQLYASDFDMDTASWDNEEVGVYFRLLMYQWVNGSIPDDISRLAKITRIGQKRFKKSWLMISNKFQNNGENRLINLRLERTRQNQDNYRKSQSEAGRRGIEKKKKEGIFPFNKSNDPLSDPLSNPSSQNQALQSSSSSLKKKKGIFKQKDFESFYSLYPNKKEKKAALAKWKSLIKSGELPPIGIILSALTAQIMWRKNPGDDFVPEWKHPTVWLNKGCWEDEVYTETQPPPNRISQDDQKNELERDK